MHNPSEETLPPTSSFLPPPTNHLYLFTQDRDNDYDTHSGAVVCAPDPIKAHNRVRDLYPNVIWSNPDLLTIKCLGPAFPTIPVGIVLDSYHTG